jgi:NADPH:quinone reductase-like Zn-dependent oxidoreductase
MKAILWTKYGPADLLQYGEIDKPIPKDNEILIRTHAATVTPGDCEIRRFDIHMLYWLPLRIYFGILKPKRPILGLEVSGIIEEMGKDVKEYKIGDQVMAEMGLQFGAYAEYVCVKTSNTIALKPSNMSHEEAATVPTAGLNALHYMRKASIQKGDKVLIKGASGCFGTYAVQLAKLSGAEVTGVDHTDKLDVLHSLGVDHTIDYTKEDFTKSSKKYDVIFDVLGNSSISYAMKRALKENGRYVLATPWVLSVIQGIWGAIGSHKKFIYDLAKYNAEDLTYLKELMEGEKLKPVIDKVYPLESVPEAHEYVESGQKIGNVAIKIG